MNENRGARWFAEMSDASMSDAAYCPLGLFSSKYSCTRSKAEKNVTNRYKIRDFDILPIPMVS